MWISTGCVDLSVWSLEFCVGCGGSLASFWIFTNSFWFFCLFIDIVFFLVLVQVEGFPGVGKNRIQRGVVET